jgi:hypothetical protein
MKGIKDGKQDVCFLFLETWKIMRERSDQINLEWFIFIVLYENMLYFSVKVSSSGRQIKYDVFVVSFRHCLQVDYSQSLNVTTLTLGLQPR